MGRTTINQQPAIGVQLLPVIPSKPGVYLMKDVRGKVIYVGKARNLKRRLASYFSGFEQSNIKTAVLVKKISMLETVITETEKEALILESNLVKRYRPRYNVVLKDDKRYPLLRVDIKSPYPNLTIVRKIEKDGALYFGPFTSPRAVHKTLKLIQKTFKLRRCKTENFKNRSRPCLNFQMGACLAPCCLDVDRIAYNRTVKEVVLFLKGRTRSLIRKVKEEMVSAARAQDYERAAILRDRMFALEKTLEKQVAVTTDLKDRDALAVARSSESSIITLLSVRGGYLTGTQHFSFSETISTDAEMVGAFVRQYYEKTHSLPKEVLVQTPLSDASLLEDWLQEKRGKRVSILWPQRGKKADVVKMAVKNAENRLKNMVASAEASMDILARLQRRLKTDRALEHIECLDTSNISGAEPVAGIVVFKKGRPNRSLYRKYMIKTVSGQNDYACMAETLKRRYDKKENESCPDLLVVDGGKGQLNIAVSVIKGLALEKKFEIIGIAKKDKKRGEVEDKVYKEGRVNPVNFGKENDLLLFLQRIRDEAHRFAISFHRKRRAMTSICSLLDSIPGIGKKRKGILFEHFGSIEGIRTATVEELSALHGIGHNLAEVVKGYTG